MIDGSVVNLLSLAITILSLVLAYIFYRRSRRFKEPSWSTRGRVILKGPRPNIPGIKVTFHDREVEHVSVDRLIIWNAGKDTISRTDLVASDRLRVESTDDATILEATILSCNHAPTSPSVHLAEDHRTAQLDFEYLDEGHGFVVQLVNTSTKSLTLKGSVKGAREVRFRHLFQPPPFLELFRSVASLPARRVILLSGTVALTIGSWVALASLGLWSILNAPQPQTRWLWLVIGFSALNVGMGISLVRRAWRPSVPKGLEAYERDFPGSC